MKFIKLLRKAFLIKYWRIYYSQFGEDAIIRELVGKKKSGTYIDVGCYHPKKFSNSYMLHKRGWRGINIDMEEDKIFLFKICRPNDFNVLSAVSDTEKSVRLFKDRDFSLGATIDQSMGEKIGAQDSEVLTIKTRTLNQIIATSPYYKKPIDLLSIDCEGHDLQVLKSIDLKMYNPKIIIIEDQYRDIEKILKGETYAYLIENGYTLKSWMHLSLIFVLTNSEFDR
jgi:hypothetical protein